MQINDFNADEYELKLLLSKPSFTVNILKLRTKWNIPAEGYAKGDDASAWRDKLTDVMRDELQSDVYELISTYGLSERWSNPLKQYLLDNVDTRLRATSYTAWKFDYEGDASNPQNIQAVWIKIDADTTERELKLAYKKAKDLLPTKRKKQAYTYLNQAIRAKALREEGLKWSEVTKQINNEFKTSYEENYVVKLVKRLEAHL